jgi:hypothetical protein
MAYETEVLDLLKQWSPDVTRVLKKAGYFDLPEGIEKEKIAEQIGFGRGTPLYRKLTQMSLEKNTKITDIVLNESSLRGFKAGARKIAEELNIPFSKYDWNPLAQTYYEKHGNQLIKTLTQTDIKSLGTQIQDNFNLTPKAFARKFADQYPCSEKRLEVIKSNEYHRATQGGMDAMQGKAGATWKRRVGHPEGIYPRETHQEDIDAGWIPFDEPYPYTDEMYPGESEINCKCYQIVSFDVEMPAE